ncbi:SDR family NAD(P)-dependent oxidoreductase [Deinococcus sp.]|uniref:SDR family NAD(P)-dependent oxidoreductase n=1 Tax=Deinococcus sp. TaxID=47478 RepID=UPI003CC5E183
MTADSLLSGANGLNVQALEFGGQVAVVSGAGGIGAACVRGLHAGGAQVLAVGLDSQALDQLQKELPEIETLEVDLRDAQGPALVVRAALERFGRLDVLLNLAGVSGRRQGDGPVHQASDQGWDTVMDLNVRATFRLCREALPSMLAQASGSIVNIASVLAYAPASEHFATHAYAACNGARIALTRSMAAYYAPHGIRVNAVAPGLIATPMSARAQQDPEILAYLAGRQPLGTHVGTAEEVAQAALFLASGRASFITGQVLEVAGGWSVAG